MTTYILNAAHEVIAADAATWGAFFEDIANRRVAETRVGPFTVSTLFLGLDQRFGDDGPPLVFETMICTDPTEPGGPHDFVGEDPDGGEFQDRCSTWAEAESSHRAAVRMAERWVSEGRTR